MEEMSELNNLKKNFLNESETCKYSHEAIKNYYDKAEAKILFRKKLTLEQSLEQTRCPFFELSETPFPQSMQDQYRSEGFVEPLPLHAISWPYILSGRYFAGTAQCDRDVWIHTFALPALLHVQDRIRTASADEESGPFALILTDHERQGKHIVEKLKAYGEPLGIKCHLISGGFEKQVTNHPMMLGLKENPHIIVACLGLEVHRIVSKTINLKRCSFLVLDDGRRLIKFTTLLKQILDQVHPDRQIVLWMSAFSNNVTSRMVHKVLTPYGFRDYSRLFFGSMAHFTEPNAVKHVVVPVTQKTRPNRLIYLIQSILASFFDPSSQRKPKFLIICNTPKFVFNILKSIGLPAFKFLKQLEVADTDKPVTNDKEVGDEMEEEADVEGIDEETIDIGKLTPRERFSRQMRQHPNVHFWLACPAVPLEEINLIDFDFLINFEIPRKDYTKEFLLRTNKFSAGTGGKGTIYSFVFYTDVPTETKGLTKFLQDANQFVPPFLYETESSMETAAPVIPNQLKSTQPNKEAGPMQRNRFVGTRERAKPYGTAMRRPNLNAGRDRFGFDRETRNSGDNGPGRNLAPKSTGNNFGGRPSNNFGNGPNGNHYGESGPAGPSRREPRNNRFSGGRNDDMLDAPNSNAGIMDAMKLVSQLKEKLLGKPTTPYGRVETPPPINNFSNNFWPNDTTDNDFPADKVRLDNKWGGRFSSSFSNESSSRHQGEGSFVRIGGSSAGNSRDRGGNDNSGGGSNRGFNSMQDLSGGNQRGFGNYSSSNWNCF